jgi:hypothetical protein
MSHSAGILIFGHAPKLGEPLFAEVSVCFTSPGDVMTFFDELKDLLKGPLDSIPLANAAVYSLGFSIFGVPAWKCVIVGVIAFAATKLHYGRRILSRLGVLVMFASVFVWADLMPDPHEWARRTRAVAAEIYLYTNPATAAPRTFDRAGVHPPDSDRPL